MQESKSNRRHFLRVICASALGAAGCATNPTTLTGGGGGNTGTMAAGNLTTLPENTLRVLQGRAVAIGRDADGLYAMSLICTHQGCDMSKDGSVSMSGVLCNCHGAAFDANGAPVSGPVHVPLAHYKVDLDANGQITIDFSKTVKATTRVAVANA